MTIKGTITFSNLVKASVAADKNEKNLSNVADSSSDKNLAYLNKQKSHEMAAQK